MQSNLELIFCGNPDLDKQIDAYLAQDPDYVQAERDFYETAQEIAQLVGFERYDCFERCLGAYLNRMSDLYYRFGLGLRQEVLQAMALPLP